MGSSRGVSTESTGNVNNIDNVFTTNQTLWTYFIPLYIGWRIWWANRMPIMDCDEVYNYWEPLHFLIFRHQHNNIGDDYTDFSSASAASGLSSFQTWEYANEYALRTYAYLTPLLVGLAKVYQAVIGYIPNWCWPLLTSQLVVIHNPNLVATAAASSATTSATDVSIYSSDNNNKVAIFILLRATLAGCMAMAEISFCKAIANHSQPATSSTTASTFTTATASTPTIGLVTAGLLISSAGMSHAAGALLPSSTILLFWLLAAAAFVRRQHTQFVWIAVVATLAIGWPFGVLMFLPMGVVILLRESFITSQQQQKLQPAFLAIFILKILGIATVVQGIVMMIDYQEYKRIVSPTWNILMYNTKGRGDELYGIEPLSYYIKNLILNFNYVAIVGVLLGLPMILVLFFFLMKNDLTLPTILIPMYIWLAVVFPRPHKEERFLFPIYPCLCLSAAIASVTIIDFWWTKLLKKKESLGLSTSLMIQAIIWAPAAVLSFSRTYALSLYYTAPLYVYAQLQAQPDVVDSVVCTCGEWYRFPSSFYLPSSIQTFGFVQSPSFEGQLPQLFSMEHGSGPNSPNKFNDQNKPEPASYIPNGIDDCDYLIDLWSAADDCRENDSLWGPVARGSFLDAERTSTIHRVLYFPFLHEQEMNRGGEGGDGGVVYDDYVLYKRLDTPV